VLYLLTGKSIDGEEAVGEKTVEEKLGKVLYEELSSILAEALKDDPFTST